MIYTGLLALCVLTYVTAKTVVKELAVRAINQNHKSQSCAPEEEIDYKLFTQVCAQSGSTYYYCQSPNGVCCMPGNPASRCCPDVKPVCISNTFCCPTAQPVICGQYCISASDVCCPNSNTPCDKAENCCGNTCKEDNEVCCDSGQPCDKQENCCGPKGKQVCCSSSQQCVQGMCCDNANVYDQGPAGKACCCNTCDKMVYNGACFQDLDDYEDLTSPSCRNCVGSSLLHVVQTRKLVSYNNKETCNDNAEAHNTDDVDMPAYSGAPNCVAMGFAAVQPSYPYTPIGGGPCACSSVTPGTVYAWGPTTGTTGATKVGCATGGDAECLTRIKQEMYGGTSFYYYCHDVSLGFSYTRQLYSGGSTVLSSCNAAEVLIQDVFYCKGMWLGPVSQSTGKPSQATLSGKSEWFGSNIDSVITEIQARVP